jgi:DNA-binding GntR family transcriptional regulator
MARAKKAGEITGSSLADAAYHRLRGEIVECRLLPGQRLTESWLSERLGAGKTPVREALGRLLQEGLMLVTPRHGYTVAPITLRDVRELFDLRLLVEPAAAEMAAGKVDGQNLAALNKLSAVGYKGGGIDSIRRFVRANSSLHSSISVLSGNRRFARLTAQLLSESERLINYSVKLRPQSERTVGEHRELIEALAKGNSGAARRIVEVHILALREMVIESLLADERFGDWPLQPARRTVHPGQANPRGKTDDNRS